MNKLIECQLKSWEIIEVYSTCDEATFTAEVCKQGYYTDNTNTKILTQVISERIVKFLQSNNWYYENSIWKHKEYKVTLLSFTPEFIRQFQENIDYDLVQKLNPEELALEYGKKAGDKKNKSDGKKVTQHKILKNDTFFMLNYNVIYSNVSKLVEETTFWNTDNVELIYKNTNQEIYCELLQLIEYFKENDKPMLNLFNNLLRDYLFLHKNKDLSKIYWGVGTNKSGKGTLVEMLSCIPFCSSIAQFSVDNLNAEYTTGIVFDNKKTTLKVCHEHSLKTKLTTGAVDLLKRHTHNETAISRLPKQAPKECNVKFSMLIFSNSRLNNELSINQIKDYLNEFKMSDRVEIYYINWTNEYSRFLDIKKIIEDNKPELGVALLQYAFDYDIENYLSNYAYDHNIELATEEFSLEQKKIINKIQDDWQKVKDDFEEKLWDNIESVNDKSYEYFIEIKCSFVTRFAIIEDNGKLILSCLAPSTRFNKLFDKKMFVQFSFQKKIELFGKNAIRYNLLNITDNKLFSV